MTRASVWFGLVTGLAILSSGPAYVRAQELPPPVAELAPPVALPPASLEVSTPAAPAQMRAEEAERLLEQMGVPSAAPAAPAALGPATVAPPSSGISRTITLEAPGVVNHDAQFKFRDVTARAGRATGPTLPPAQRHAAVEAYRQSLVKAKGAMR